MARTPDEWVCDNHPRRLPDGALRMFKERAVMRPAKKTTNVDVIIDQSALPIEWWPIARLRVNPHNVRTHSRRQIRQILESIETFGFVVPVVVDEDGVILSGHGRRE